MKKILKGVLITFAVFIVLIIAAGVFLTHDWSRPEKKSASEVPTYTDPSGNVYSVVVDTDGVTFAAIPDENNNVWQVRINSDGTLGETVASLNDYVSADDVLSGQNFTPWSDNGATTPNIPTQAAKDGFANHPENTTQSTNDENETTASPSSPSSESIPVVTTKPAEEKTLNFERYRSMYSSGTYHIVFTTNDEDLGDAPIISAKKGKNVLVTTTIEGMTGTVIYRGDVDKTYFVVDDMKQYFSIPKRFMGEDIDMSEMDLISGFFSEDIDTSKFKSETKKVDGKKLTVESYVTKSGTKRLYYFDNGELVRIDSVDESGESSEFYIQSITNDVPDSTFDIPEGYGFLNLSWLL